MIPTEGVERGQEEEEVGWVCLARQIVLLLQY